MSEDDAPPLAVVESRPAPDQVTLYHFPSSVDSQKVRLALAEKGVAWQGKTVNIGPAHEQFEPWYAKLNPRLAVPTLEVRNGEQTEVVTNAVDIAAYLDEIGAGDRLLPEEPEFRVEVIRWVERHDQLPLRVLGYARSKGVVRWFQRWNLGQQRKRLRRLAKQNPDLADVYEAKLAEVEELTEASRNRAVVVDELVDLVEVTLDDIEQTLQDREWLAGDRYTLADLMWTAVLARLSQLGFARSLSERRHPRVAEWYAALKARPSWSEGIRRLAPKEIVRFYGPAVAKTFLIAWAAKWLVLTPLIYGITQLTKCAGN